MNKNRLRKILIFTAALGGGHEAAGRAVRDEAKRAGYGPVMMDGLRTMSPALDRLLVQAYSTQGRNNQKSLGVTYAVTSQKAAAAAVGFLAGSLFANRLLKVVQRERPDLVVSTYPLVTAALGRLRRNGGLKVPAVAVIPDYGVHPLWVAPSVDLHLVVSRQSAEMVKRIGASSSVVQMPVAPCFQVPPTRDEARATLGLPREAFVALVVGGALGIGDLEEATRCATEAGAYAVVVTGENAHLKTRLEEKFQSEKRVRVLGWRRDMPTLMAAADCLIQNAGGMTCIEAIRVGLPILIFNPIPGHGELNAEVMEQASTARWVRDAESLRNLLRSAVRHETSLSASNTEPDIPTVCEVFRSLTDGSTFASEADFTDLVRGHRP
jgi:UDP-N-acetylglucosamine:LPS N-acetylglucosamine transferase